jgi:hypothetical protein
MSIPEEEELSLDSNDGEDSIMSSSSYGNSEEAEAIVEDEDAHFSTTEEHGMTKTKTIYIFRNENHLNESVANRKPLAGVVEVTTLPSGETAFEFQMIFRKPVKLFARRKVLFNDEAGINFHGLWWAEIEVEATESIQSTAKFSDIQLSAKLSAVAIPLCYIIGREKADSNKYCVITNWWKERVSNGSYSLPTLDASLYTANDPDNHGGNNVI